MLRLTELSKQPRRKWIRYAAPFAVLILLAFLHHILASAVQAGLSVLMLIGISMVMFLIIQFLPYVLQVFDRWGKQALLADASANPAHQLHAQREKRHEELREMEHGHREMVTQVEKLKRAIERVRARAPGGDVSALEAQYARLRAQCEASFERLLQKRASVQQFDLEVELSEAKWAAANAGKRALESARPRPREAIMDGRLIEAASGAVDDAMADLEAGIALIEADDPGFQQLRKG